MLREAPSSAHKQSVIFHNRKSFCLCLVFKVRVIFMEMSTLVYAKRSLTFAGPSTSYISFVYFSHEYCKLDLNSTLTEVLNKE